MAKPKKKYLKRTNGSGTVYKLSGNRRRPWVSAVTKGWDENGKQIKEIIGYFEERDDALLALLTYEPDNQPITKKTTIKELYDLIIDEAEKEGKAKSTLDGWTASYKALEPLKDKALYDLTAMDFQSVIDDIIEDPKAAKSFGKLNKIKAFISKMYSILIKYKVMDINHSQFISLRGVKEGEVPPFSETDIEILFKNDGDRIAKSSLILAYTGFRIGEFLDLKKENIDMERWLIIGGSKTEAGKDRVVVVHSKIQKYIEYFYNEFPDCEYLFSRDGVNKVRYEYYREYYHQPMIKKYGLSNLGVHSFRHTAASKMRMAGVDDKALMEIIGHVDAKFTDKRYVSVDTDYLHQQMEKVK